MRRWNTFAPFRWLAIAGLCVLGCDDGGGGQLWVYDAEGGTEHADADPRDDAGEVDPELFEVRDDTGDDRVEDDGAVEDYLDDAAPDVPCVPAGSETCNGRDDDCDGLTDPDGAPGCTDYFADADGDTHADPETLRCACGTPSTPGWVPSSSAVLDDCDDARADVHPGAPETCDGVDDDCDGLLAPSEDADADGAASVACGGDDCDDADERRHPGLAEAATLSPVFEDPAAAPSTDALAQVLGLPDGTIHVLFTSPGVRDLSRDPTTGTWTFVTVPGSWASAVSAQAMTDGSLGLVFLNTDNHLFWSDGATSVDTGLTMYERPPSTALGITDAANTWLADRSDESGPGLDVLRWQAPGRWTREPVPPASTLHWVRPYAAFRLVDGSPALLFGGRTSYGGSPQLMLARRSAGSWSVETIATIEIGSTLPDFAAGGVDAAGGLVVALDDDVRPLRVYRQPRGATTWTLAFEESLTVMRDGSFADPRYAMGPSGRIAYTTWDADWESIRLRVIEPITGGVLTTHWQVDSLRTGPWGGAAPAFLPDGRLAIAYHRGDFRSAGFRVAFLSRSVGDGIDSDCDGHDLLDGDADGHAPWLAGGDDCDDGNPGIHSASPDTSVDGIDQNCNGMDGVDRDRDLSASVASGGDDCDEADRRRLPTAFDGADLTHTREDLAAPSGYTWTDADRWNGRPAALGTATSALGIGTFGTAGTWSIERVSTPTTAVAAPSYDPFPAGGFERQLSYYDSTADDLYWGGYAAGAWVFERVDDVGDVGAVSQVVARTSEIQVLYRDGTSRTNRLARRTPTGWTTERLDDNPPAWFDLQRSPDGTPYLVTTDTTGGDRFLHPVAAGWGVQPAYAVHTMWQRLGVAGLGFLLDVPWIGFTDMPLSDVGHIHRQRFEAATFVDEFVEQLEGGVCLLTIDAMGRFWYLFDRSVRMWDDTSLSPPIPFTFPFSNVGRMSALPDGSIEAVFLVSGRVERLRLFRPGDGVDNDCDGVDGIDADRDGYASYDSGGDDCDDTTASVHPAAADPAGDGIDADCDLQDG